MNFDWNDYLSEGEKVEMDFGISNTYTTGIIGIATLFAVVLALTNLFVGMGVFALGILYWFYLTRGRRYALTNKKIIILDMQLGKNVINISYDKITDISVQQNVIDMMGNWGTVVVNTAGTNFPEAYLQNISDPQKVKNKIDNLSESSKK